MYHLFYILINFHLSLASRLWHAVIEFADGLNIDKGVHDIFMDGRGEWYFEIYTVGVNAYILNGVYNGYITSNGW